MKRLDKPEKALKPLVIPVFIPHSGCPHQCAFCNQSIITSQKSSLPDEKAIHQIVTEYLHYKGRREQVELAFFGGNFLGLAQDTIVQLLDWVSPYVRENKIDGIRFSTRPDTITREKLELLEPYSVSTVELGVQSMNDAVLFASRRGHKAKDTLTAVDLLRKYPVKIGVQVMVGLPGDSETALFDSTKLLAGLGPDFARIYPLMVLKGSMMEHWYQKGKYKVLSLEESIRLVKEMYRIFTAAGVDVVRMGLQASDMMEDESMVLAGPWHPAFGHLVYSDVLYDMVCNKIDQTPDLFNSKGLILRVHPTSESRLRGEKNGNLKKLAQRYPGVNFSILRDDSVPVNQVQSIQKLTEF